MNVRMLALCGLAGLGAAACVGSEESAPLRILGNAAPGDGCSVDSASTIFLDDGVIEAGSAFGYIFTPTVRNDLQTVGDELIGPKTIYVTHARVSLRFYDPAFEDITSDNSLLVFQVPTSGSIEPNGGLSAFSFEVTPPELLALIGQRLGGPTVENPRPRTTLDARVQLYGSRGGGGGEEISNVYRYPIEVCNGCLSADLGACVDLPADFEARTGGVCNTDQDGIVDCCDNFTVCPAVAPEPEV